MSKDIDVSGVTPADFTDIVDIEKRIEGENAASLDLINSRFSMFADGFLVARIDERIVGYIESCIWDEEIPVFNSGKDFFSSRHKLNGNILYIIFLGVVPEYWRQGVASKLIRGVKGLSRKIGVKKVHAVTWDHLTGLYVKQGFKPIRKMPNFLPNGSFTLLEYSLAEES